MGWVRPEATYDLSGLVGRVRFHCADTNPSMAVWTDAELAYCLELAGNVPELAAARALRAAAADASKLAVITSIGQIKNDERGIGPALLALAEALEAQAALGGAITSPDKVFTTAAGATPGSMDTW